MYKQSFIFHHKCQGIMNWNQAMRAFDYSHNYHRKKHGFCTNKLQILKDGLYIHSLPYVFNTECHHGYFGYQCLNPCSTHCSTNLTCNHTSGDCLGGCKEGYLGQNCTKSKHFVTICHTFRSFFQNSFSSSVCFLFHHKVVLMDFMG